ncbi:hypothetical protein DRE_01316 [Drechslerella stenobrocha 248]|uniref:RNase H type-1 domain-containing protein n=1 Tax=Drechslerella stenobrocha 248 TaxID=1043628 RepID=W7HLN4_9PEZI|nr:hypothetical protein DRE_01316 [Drechslerella stenobrocha 248]
MAPPDASGIANVKKAELYSDAITDQMLERTSNLFIDTNECEVLGPEIQGSNTTIAHLPDETRFIIQVLKAGPMSLINHTFFKFNLHGRSMPWLNGQTIYFPDAEKYKPACILQMGQDNSSRRDHGIAVPFRKPKGGTCLVQVWGIAEVPLFIGGIPLRVSCLIVDSLPLHRTRYNGEPPQMLLLSNIFNGKTVPLRFHSNLMLRPVNLGVNIVTAVVPHTGNIALEVYADIANSKPHKRGALYDISYGIWFAEDSIFNINGTMEAGTAKVDVCLELRGALQVVYAVRDMSLYIYSHFDFTDVIIYCSSRHIVDWAPEWAAHWQKNGWVQSLKLDQRVKDLWDELMHAQKVAKRTFIWAFLDPKHNDEAISLSRSAMMGIKGPEWGLLPNENYNLAELRKMVKPKQRPGNYFQGLALEGGMCRKSHPRGFRIETCCLCFRTGWETHIHF